VSQQDINMAVQAALETFPNDEKGNQMFREFIAKLFVVPRMPIAGPPVEPPGGRGGPMVRYGAPM